MHCCIPDPSVTRSSDFLFVELSCYETS
uniref:Uncharacterized protein n=1 Tax=Arundo donax TaxID=35708 RepID=A0A0A9HJR1_ARUDO